MHTLTCTWCEQQYLSHRSNARTCCKPCRQAKSHAGFKPADPTPFRPARRIAYADPPYPGSARHYKHQPEWTGEINLPELAARLATFDAWALSTSAAALPLVLSHLTGAGRQIRIAAWIRTPRPHRTARILNAWQPVIYLAPRGSRIDTCDRQTTDVLDGPTPRRRSTLPHAIIGMKSPQFALWVFRLLDAAAHDTFVDLYPGSGIITNAWLHYSGQRPTSWSTHDRRLKHDDDHH